jgi:hypothetical protein
MFFWMAYWFPHMQKFEQSEVSSQRSRRLGVWGGLCQPQTPNYFLIIEKLQPEFIIKRSCAVGTSYSQKEGVVEVIGGKHTNIDTSHPDCNL